MERSQAPMVDYDTAIKRIVKRGVPELLDFLEIPRDLQRGDTDLGLNFPKRADFFSHAVAPEIGCYHVEFQMAEDVQLSFRMMEYFVAIHRNEGYRLGEKSHLGWPTPTLLDNVSLVQIVLHLRRAPSRHRYIKRRRGGTENLLFTFRHRFIGDIGFMKFLDSGNPDAIILSVLSRDVRTFTGEQLAQIIFHRLEEVPATVMRGRLHDYLADLYLLSRLNQKSVGIRRGLNGMGLTVTISDDEVTVSQHAEMLQEFMEAERIDILSRVIRKFRITGLADEVSLAIEDLDIDALKAIQDDMAGADLASVAQLIIDRAPARNMDDSPSKI